MDAGERAVVSKDCALGRGAVTVVHAGLVPHGLPQGAALGPADLVDAAALVLEGGVGINSGVGEHERETSGDHLVDDNAAAANHLAQKQAVLLIMRQRVEILERVLLRDGHIGVGLVLGLGAKHCRSGAVARAAGTGDVVSRLNGDDLRAAASGSHGRSGARGAQAAYEDVALKRVARSRAARLCLVGVGGCRAECDTASCGCSSGGNKGAAAHGCGDSHV